MEKLKKLNKGKIGIIWKLAVAFIVCIGVFAVANSFATAETLKLTITGEQLNDGTWEVGSEPVVWTAQCYDSENGQYMSLEDGGSIVWTSSDPNIVDITQSSQGSESTATLKPLSAGKVKITATYTKTITTEDGDYELSAKSERNVIVKFDIYDNNLPTAPYEDNWTLPAFTTNSVYPLTWLTSNDSVATVADDGSGSGVITLVGAGKATITAKTSDGQSESFDIAVNAKFMEANPFIKLENGEYYTLTTNAKHAANVHFESARPNVVSVDGDGVIHAESAGKTYIYVYSLASDDKWYDLQPKPVRNIPVIVDFKILSEPQNMGVEDETKLVTNIPAEFKNAVNWISSDTSVVTVDADGTVKAVGNGTATITASLLSQDLFGTTDVQKSTVTISVIDTFALSEYEHILNVGESFELRALITDESASVTWKSSNTSVATVTTDKNEKFKVVITGKSKGAATITATQVVNGVSKTAKCEISVKQSVNNITISPAQVEIIRGTQYRLIATFNPSRPDNMNVTWVSSDPNIVKVDDTGVITGVKGGQAAVSVVTEDGIKIASCTVTVREPVTSIKLDIHKVTTSLSTKTYQLTYSILPAGEGVNRNVTWQSSAPDVATVGPNGLVTFVKPGKATIIVQTEDTGIDGNLIDTCEFYINQPVTAVDLDYTSITLKKDDKFRLTAKVSPDDATNKKIIWTSSDPSVCTVNEDGMVYALASGSATILAKSEDSGATSMCNVTVYQPVTSIVISNETMSVRKGTEFWLNAKAMPENAMNKEIVWSSNDTNVAKVDKNGKVTALEAGECVITATSVDSGVTARCVLTVLQPITGIELNVNEKTIMKGDRFVLIPYITPLDANNKNVTYTSSDTTVASVDAQGIVTGLKGGVAIIVCKTEERGLIASCQVTVHEFVSSVEIDDEELKMNVGDSRKISVTVGADSATNKKVTFSSSNKAIATVDGSGKITAVAPGRVTIYASATDGSGLSDSIVIEVIKPVKSVTITPDSVTVSEGKSAKVTAIVLPVDATYKDVDWSSSNPEIATVDYSGEITGIKAGTCRVTAKSSDGNNIIGTVKVTVKATVPATGVVINSKSITMLPGQTRQLSARLKPTKATEGVVWVSGDTSVATVSSTGVVTAKGQGNTEIYAISSETGVESACEVIVLALNATYVTLEQYDSFDLDVFGATDKIKWYSNNKRVATVSSNGLVVARMAGTTTITAKVNGKVLYCTVRVTTMRK